MFQDNNANNSPQGVDEDPVDSDGSPTDDRRHQHDRHHHRNAVQAAMVSLVQEKSLQGQYCDVLPVLRVPEC